MKCLECKGKGTIDAEDRFGRTHEVDCARCDGDGQEETYTLPLKTVKKYLESDNLERGEILRLECMGKYNPDYTKLGRNFGAYLVRNMPKKYVAGIKALLNERA